MIKKGRGSSVNVKNGVRAAILYVKTLHDDWSPARIENHLKVNRANFNLELNEIPVDRTIRNVIEREKPALAEMKDRVNTKEFMELEAPWNLGLCGKYKFLTPDLIWLITEIQRVTKVIPGRDITIRRALWIARLSGFAKPYLQNLDKNWIKEQVKKFKYKNEDSFIQKEYWRYLEENSQAYAFFETKWQLSGRALPADTSELDTILIKGGSIWVNQDRDTKKESLFATSNKDGE